MSRAFLRLYIFDPVQSAGEPGPRRSLLHVRSMMGEIILNKKLQSHRLVRAHHANRVQAIFRNVVHHCGENLVLNLSPLQQRLPWLLCIAMHLYPSHLLVAGACVESLRRGSHKALTIIRRGIQQVTDNLLSSPAALPPGNVRQGCWKCEQDGAAQIQLGTEMIAEQRGHGNLLCKSSRQFCGASKKNHRVPFSPRSCADVGTDPVTLC